MLLRLLFYVLACSFSPGFAQDLQRLGGYDVVVVGSEPEGISAAVAAAETGATVLLITEEPRLGGLFVMSQMNSLDLRTSPVNFQQGFFQRWWARVGLGHSFDVERAEAAFEAMLEQAGVEVTKVDERLYPVVSEAGSSVEGVGLGQLMIPATQVIDATPDANFAAAAGADFSFGFSSLGLDERMVDTLVFRIDGVDWTALQAGIKARGGDYARVDEHVAWGHFGGYPAAYEALEEGIRLRGLNLGRQEDDTVLVNALLIHGIDLFERESVIDGFRRAEREAPRIIDYLKREIPGFEEARFGGVADRLYVRESRHLEAECMLTLDDVLDNRVGPLDIAVGGYPLDVQQLTPFDTGFVYGVPEIYGVELCVTIPKEIDDLWVVGKAAGYDPIAHSSARVVPFGMAVAEAVGVAAAIASTSGFSPRAYAADPGRIQGLRSELKRRGAYLPPPQPYAPVGPVTHPYYQDYRTLARRGLALGGYSNDPKLEAHMNAVNYIYLLSNVGQRFLADTALGQQLLEQFGGVTGPLTPDLALTITHAAACQLGSCPEASWGALIEADLAPAAFPPEGLLTRGEIYALAARLAAHYGDDARAETR